MYSKTCLFFKDKEIDSRKKNCFKAKNLLDFSKEHKFKVEGESLSDFHIKIELKNCTQIFQKSKFLIEFFCKRLSEIFPDCVVADLKLGPNEPGNKSEHWRKMMDNPGERIFMWHELNCASAEK